MRCRRVLSKTATLFFPCARESFSVGHLTPAHCIRCSFRPCEHPSCCVGRTQRCSAVSCPITGGHGPEEADVAGSCRGSFVSVPVLKSFVLSYKHGNSGGWAKWLVFVCLTCALGIWDACEDGGGENNNRWDKTGRTV